MLQLCLLVATLSTICLENVIRDKKKVPSHTLRIGVISGWLFLSGFSWAIGYLEIYGKGDHVDPSASLIPFHLPMIDISLNLTQFKSQINPFPDATSYSNWSMVIGDVSLDQFNTENATDACIAILGSSHGMVYYPIFKELGEEFNVSIGYLAYPGAGQGQFHDPPSEFDRYKMDKLRQWKPRRMFLSDFYLKFNDWEIDTVNKTKKTVETMLSYSPESVVVFGDVPYVPVSVYKGPIQKWIAHKMAAQDTLDALGDADFVFRKRHLRVENDIKMTIDKNFKDKNVTFYPVWPFFVSPTTEKLQIVGFEMKGKTLYYDNDHINSLGANRLKNVIKKFMFDDIQCH
eukprot:Awhi_evm1s9070